MAASPASREETALADSDGELLAAYARRGEETAFTALVARHVGLVMGTARRRTGDPHVAEEVAQTTFSILARKAASLDRVESLAAWLHRVAVRQSIRALRQLARHRRKLEAAMHDSQLHRTGRDPFDEALSWLDDALEALSDSDRQLLILRYYERLSFADAARRLGRSEAALRQQAGRAVERLSVWLRRRGVAVPGAAIASSLGISLAGPSASVSAVSLLARSALAAAPGVSGVTVWTTTLFSMSTIQSTVLAGAAALFLASIPLGWQRLEMARMRVEISDAVVTPAGRAVGIGQSAVAARGLPQGTLGAAPANGEPSAVPPAPTRNAAAEPMSDPMDAIPREFVRRKAEAEADRTAFALGMSPDQSERYRAFLEQSYRDRADAASDDERARLRREEREKREQFLASLLDPDGLARYTEMQQRRDEASFEKAAGEALHEFARAVDLTEGQKQRLFQAFAEAARDDAGSSRPSSFELRFGYGIDSGGRLTDDEAALQVVLTPEQLALWRRHGHADPDMARHALELIAPMVAGDPDIWRQMGRSVQSSPDKPTAR